MSSIAQIIAVTTSQVIGLSAYILTTVFGTVSRTSAWAWTATVSSVAYSISVATGNTTKIQTQTATYQNYVAANQTSTEMRTTKLDSTAFGRVLADSSYTEASFSNPSTSGISAMRASLSSIYTYIVNSSGYGNSQQIAEAGQWTNLQQSTDDNTVTIRDYTDGRTKGQGTRYVRVYDTDGTTVLCSHTMDYSTGHKFTGPAVFETGAAGASPLIARQTGGVAGTDDLELYHDGTDGYVRSRSGAAIIRTANRYFVFYDTGYLQTAVGVSGFIDWQIDYNALAMRNSMAVTWSSGDIGSPDTSLAREAAGVIKVGDGSTGSGWLQNTAGRKRLASAVTNITTTFANLTDLTVTLKAGRKYTGHLCLPINGGLAADGVKFDLNGGTATMTSVHYGFESAIGATIGTRTSTALATAINITALADTNDVYIKIPITLVVNAAGTLIPRQAKDSDAAGATLTHRAGGYLWLEDTP